MICNTCGRSIKNEEANFCEYCGASLRGQTSNGMQSSPKPPVYEAVIREEKPISFLNWLGSYLLMYIPYIGLIMLFIWSFGRNVPESKKNWARANLVIMLIMLVVLIIIITTIGPEQLLNMMVGDMTQYNNIY